MAPFQTNIKILAAAGVPPSKAIKAALNGKIHEFAERHGLPRTAVSMCIHGRQKHNRVRDALAHELGVSREWLDEFLDGGSEPPAAVNQ